MSWVEYVKSDITWWQRLAPKFSFRTIRADQHINSSNNDSLIIMRLYLWLSLVGACAIATAAEAQESRSRTASAARAIAASLAASHRDVGGTWVLATERGCSTGARQQPCTFRNLLSTKEDSVVVAELGKNLQATTDVKVLDDVKSLRLAIAARAQAESRRVACGDKELDRNAIKLLQIDESRANGDTVQIRLTVAQYGSFAYCAGGAQVYLLTSVEKAGTPPTVSMKALEHYELMLEVPRQKNQGISDQRVRQNERVAI